MARLCKSSVLVCLALLCEVAMGSPNNGGTSSSSSGEGLQSEEDSLPSPVVQGNGRVRTDVLFDEDRAAQREIAERFAPGIRNSNRPSRPYSRRWQLAMRGVGSSRLPKPEEPSLLADPPRVATTFENVNRNDVFDRNPEPAGQTQSQANNHNPTRPSSSAQNPFPIVVVQPDQSNGNTRPVQIFSQSNDESGLNIPVASGGIERPNNIVPQDQLFVRDNAPGFDRINPSNTQSSQGSSNSQGSPNLNTNNNFGSSSGSSNSGGSPNAFPSRNSNTDLGSTGTTNSGGSPNAFPSRNSNTDFGSTGITNSGGSPNAFPSRNSNTNIGSSGSTNSGGSPNSFPSQNTNNNIGSPGSVNDGGSPGTFPFQNSNNNFGSSTGSVNGGSSQRPSTGSVGSPAKGSPTDNNFSQSSGSTNKFPVQNNNKFGGGQTYPEIIAVVNAIQKFTLDLLATFRDGSQNTIVYSPVSISSLLSLLTLATNGNSKREIEDALFSLTPSSRNDQHNSFETILERLNHLSQGITISTSSRLFLEQNMNISGRFTDGAKKHYNCSVSLENFRGTPQQTMQRVNSWIEEETRGKITQFIDEPFRSDTKFVAANTIYFDGKWATPFSESFTSERDFDTGKEVIQIPMMNNIFETLHYYCDELNVDVTSLPYSGDEFAMIIILPRESPREKKIMDLEKQLNATIIESLISKMTSKSVSIALPKMKLAMKTSLVENLSELRIRSIFSPSTADFSSLTETKPLWVSQFLHEAVMEVTEVGTVAAAVSAVSIQRMGHQIVNVNKPAIIFIRDMVTRVPLFWTRLVKPERVPESGQKKTPSPTKFK